MRQEVYEPFRLPSCSSRGPQLSICLEALAGINWAVFCPATILNVYNRSWCSFLLLNFLSFDQVRRPIEGCIPLNWYIELVVCGHMYTQTL